MPVLVQKRRSTGASKSRRAHAEDAAMPQYRAPTYPLSSTTERELSSIAATHSNRKYDHHLDQSIQLISRTVGPLNEMVQVCKEKLEEWGRRREAKAREQGQVITKTDREVDMERRIEELEMQVAEQTLALEKELRNIIGKKAALQDEKQCLQQAVNQVRGRKRKYEDAKQELRRAKAEREANRSENGGEENDRQQEERDVEDEEPVEDDQDVGITPLRQFNLARDSQRQEYEGLSPYQRYGADNDYAAFRKVVHDAQHPDDGTNLPHAKRWFDENGKPAHLLPCARRLQIGDGRNLHRNVEDGKEDEEDEDIVIAGESRDWRCPLSMVVLEDPVTSKKCPHSFEKAAFRDYLRTSMGTAPCPVSGCGKVSAFFFFPRPFFFLGGGGA